MKQFTRLTAGWVLGGTRPLPLVARFQGVGASADAAVSYRQALALVTNDSERHYLGRRLREVQR